MNTTSYSGCYLVRLVEPLGESTRGLDFESPHIGGRGVSFLSLEINKKLHK